jgi:hypothetical protein
LLAFLAIKNGKIILLYLKPTKREFKWRSQLVITIYL